MVSVGGAALQVDGESLMAGDKEANRKDDEALQDEDEQGRQRSTIGFPYMDLQDAVDVSAAIYGNVGQGDCDEDQLAAWLHLSPKSSGFRVRLATARMFGVIESGSGGALRVTALGRQIIDAQQTRAARVRAFLNVPLYRAVFDKYKGDVLPPAAAFERDIMQLGVAEKQKGRARQVFERAAAQAGFFEQGMNRLVRPGVAEVDPPPPKDENTGGGGGGGGGDVSQLHPFIQGLLKTLPKPETEWKSADRAKWLQTAANIFDLIYKGDGGIEVRAAAANRSPRPND